MNSLTQSSCGSCAGQGCHNISKYLEGIGPSWLLSYDIGTLRNEAKTDPLARFPQ